MSAVISLQDRGVVEIAGADATKFLHNLVTNDIAKLAPGEARFCALLAPQGKILVDFLVFAEGEGETRRYLLDCPSELGAGPPAPPRHVQVARGGERHIEKRRTRSLLPFSARRDRKFPRWRWRGTRAPRRWAGD